MTTLLLILVSLLVISQIVFWAYLAHITKTPIEKIIRDLSQPEMGLILGRWIAYIPDAVIAQKMIDAWVVPKISIQILQRIQDWNSAEIKQFVSLYLLLTKKFMENMDQEEIMSFFQQFTEMPAFLTPDEDTPSEEEEEGQWAFPQR